MNLDFPNVIYEMYIESKGDFVTFKNELVKDKYNERFVVENTGRGYNIYELSKRLESLGFSTAILEDKKLFVSKDGVHAHINFSKYLAYENTTVKQFVFIMEKLKEERDMIIKKSVKDFQERLLTNYKKLNERKL